MPPVRTSTFKGLSTSGASECGGLSGAEVPVGSALFEATLRVAGNEAHLAPVLVPGRPVLA
eukprot:scaffold304903_cov40-Tisochrysis_lutea.AAC.2